MLFSFAFEVYGVQSRGSGFTNYVMDLKSMAGAPEQSLNAKDLNPNPCRV